MVSSNTPFKVTLGDKTVLEESQLVFTNGITISIEINSNILLLRESGGQKYYIIAIINEIN